MSISFWLSKCTDKKKVLLTYRKHPHISFRVVDFLQNPALIYLGLLRSVSPRVTNSSLVKRIWLLVSTLQLKVNKLCMFGSPDSVSVSRHALRLIRRCVQSLIYKLIVICHEGFLWTTDSSRCQSPMLLSVSLSLRRVERLWQACGTDIFICRCLFLP